jgi:peptide-methionine (S)-S-oxide reductase
MKKLTYCFGILVFAAFVWFSTVWYANAQEQVVKSKNKAMKIELATFGGGCFWCTEAIFEQVNGVIEATSGYSGGVTKNPTYRDVCTGRTGHAEVIQVKYNPEIVTYVELLEIFFKTHDPTTKDRQGADRGNQYRSIILYHTELQKETAVALIKELNDANIWDNPIVSEVVPFEVFYSAEAYHQEYFENNSGQMYCQMVIVPKLEKFEKLFRDKLKQK